MVITYHKSHFIRPNPRNQNEYMYKIHEVVNSVAMSNGNGKVR